ncbi:DUF397 domain-containing protein [Streptomyces sp. H27-D2]|uniref:DUF397 domain-containing protein n=1 Tax=Streptomyces sp. H27-D2 TaxID=3046304 RepID=UPI002DB8DA86|nr:DUF397 domain-containing protein [Streptomyces sp. H27-D2]MEC4017355.1 DUF397 domain-containing protein [Streptomyces sp. H27-D2]
MPGFEFVKSSYSTPDRECVEVALNVPAAVVVRDSKDPAGPILRFAPAAWAAFHASAARGDFDLS